MRIRRYTGKDAQEAMLKVKMDLGSEAIILNTRKVRKKGVKGMFSKPLTEVLAAVDNDYGLKKRVTDTQKAHKPNDDKIRVELIENRIKKMELMLERINSGIQDSNSYKLGDGVEAFENHKQNNHYTTIVSESVVKNADKSFSLFTKTLTDNEVDPEIIGKLVHNIKQVVRNAENYDEIITAAKKIVQDILGQPQTINFREDGKPTVVMFLGPTGVGKTTTLAKIAAEYSLNHKKKIAFITADTYRIAAVEQLKTYAEILNIPVSVIYTPKEIKEAISEYQDRDLILIDTAGRSHKNESQFSELKMLVNAAVADEMYLVLSCNISRTVCRDILKHYSFLKDYKLLFTKFDEALVPGIILNVRYATGKPLSYITIGQSVPDDIEIANIGKIVESMLQQRESAV